MHGGQVRHAGRYGLERRRERSATARRPRRRANMSLPGASKAIGGTGLIDSLEFLPSILMYYGLRDRLRL